MRPGSKLSKRRREVLKSVGIVAGGISLAGCSGDGGGNTDGNNGGGNTDGNNGESNNDGNDAVPIHVIGTGGSFGEDRKVAFYDRYRNGEAPWDQARELNFTAMPWPQRQSRSQTERDNPPCDCIEMNLQTGTTYTREGIFEPHKEMLDDWDQIAPAFKNEEVAGNFAATRGHVYRSDKIDGEIRTWDDWLNDDLKGKIALPAWGDTGQLLYVVNNAKGGSLDNLDPGFQWVEKVLELDPVIYEGFDHCMDLFRNGEIWLTYFTGSRCDQLRSQYNLDMTYTIPEGGAAVALYNWSIFSARPEEKKQQAAEFVNGSLAPEPQARFAEVAGFVPTNPAAKELISEEAREKYPSAIMTDEEIERLNAGLDWVAIAEQKSEDASRWRQLVGSN